MFASSVPTGPDTASQLLSRTVASIDPLMCSFLRAT